MSDQPMGTCLNPGGVAAALETTESFPGWARLSGWGLKSLLRRSKRHRIAARGVIFREGEPARFVAVLRRGLVKLVRHAPDGRIRVVRLHTRGAWIGLGGLLQPVNEHTAIAVNEVEVYRIPLRTIVQLKEHNLSLYCRLTETWFQCLRSADVWITHFSSGPVRARVARLINFLSTLQNDASSPGVTLLTCEEMGGVLGVTAESVSRILAEFKRNGALCELPGAPANWYQRNEEALRRVARE